MILAPITSLRPKLQTRFAQLTTAVATLYAQFVVAVQVARAQVDWDGNCVYTDPTAGEVATIQGVECLLRNVLQTATTFIALAAFVMVIIGAFYYLTSGGNPKGMETGKKSITYGFIGIVLALSAFMILQFISGFTGVRGILEFNLNIGS